MMYGTFPLLTLVSTQPLLSLPDWFMVGGTFEQDALGCGYSEEFLKHVMAHSSDTNSRISKSSTEAVKPSTGNILVSVYIQHLAETYPDPVNFLVNLRSIILDMKELSRVDMEIIARVANCLCFSACVSSSDDFKDDVLAGIEFGDTIATWERFISNEAYKGRTLLQKMLYFDVDHISRYNFDGAYKVKISMIQTLLDECWQYKNNPSDEILETIMDFANTKDSEEYKIILDDIKMRFGINFPGDMVESGAGVSS
jgi:hypothetical protein